MLEVDREWHDSVIEILRETLIRVELSRLVNNKIWRDNRKAWGPGGNLMREPQSALGRISQSLGKLGNALGVRRLGISKSSPW